MINNFGLLPDRKALNAIAPILTKRRKSLINILMEIGPMEYSATREIKTLQKFDRETERLYSDVKRWMRKYVTDSFTRARNIGVRVMENYGQTKAENFTEENTQAMLQERINKIDGYYRKSFQSMQQQARKYFYMLRKISERLARIEEIGGLSAEDEAVLLSQIEELSAEGASRGRIAKMTQDFLREKVGKGNLIEINGKFYDVKKHSMTIARSELRKTQSDGIRSACAEYDNDLVQISDHGTETEICMEYEGNIYSLSGTHPQYPMLDMEPPFHPNCLIPGNKVISPGGFIAGIRARYDGPAVELSFANTGDLSVTKNHLLLTPYGFTPAHLLRKGDYVIYSPSFERIVSSHPYNDGYPSIIEQVIETLLESQGMSSGSVPVSSEYLHNDGRFCNGDVDIIRPDGFLGNASKPFFFKKGKALFFNRSNTDSLSFPSEGDFLSMLQALSFTADGIMSGRRLPSALFSAQSRHGDTVNFAGRAGLDACFDDIFSNDIPVDSQFFGNVDKQISRFIQTNCFADIKSAFFSPSDASTVAMRPEFESTFKKLLSDRLGTHIKFLCDLISRHSGLIKFDKVLDVRKINFSGHIYDLHTLSSLYLANGVLSSNCQHSMLPTSEAALRAREAYG